jgi:hypothetical protein
MGGAQQQQDVRKKDTFEQVRKYCEENSNEGEGSVFEISGLMRSDKIFLNEDDKEKLVDLFKGRETSYPYFHLGCLIDLDAAGRARPALRVLRQCQRLKSASWILETGDAVLKLFGQALASQPSADGTPLECLKTVKGRFQASQAWKTENEEALEIIVAQQSALIAAASLQAEEGVSQSEQFFEELAPVFAAVPALDLSGSRGISRSAKKGIGKWLILDDSHSDSVRIGELKTDSLDFNCSGEALDLSKTDARKLDVGDLWLVTGLMASNQLSSLVCLDLQNCNLNKEYRLEPILELVKSNKGTMRTLVLSNNKMGAKLGGDLASAFKDNTTITSVRSTAASVWVPHSNFPFPCFALSLL